MHYVIAYDVEKDRRRNRVMNVLKDFGLRVQYSVFECELTRDRLALLLERLEPLIDRRHDRLHVYPLCDACYFRTESWGQDRN